jgi:hypothetical protein
VIGLGRIVRVPCLSLEDQPDKVALGAFYDRRLQQMFRNWIDRREAAEDLYKSRTTGGDIGVVLDVILGLIFFGQLSVVSLDHFAPPLQNHIQILLLACSDGGSLHFGGWVDRIAGFSEHREAVHCENQ